jgi:ABC-type xylose transport system substrate-binding protein
MLEDILDKYYKKTFPEILITAHDDLAGGCIEQLTKERCDQEQWPLIVGQQATEAGLERIKEGTQFLSVCYGVGTLATACAEMADRVLQGEAAAVTVWNNGESDIPADMHIPLLVNEENYLSVM